jgi:hypothetical protein
MIAPRYYREARLEARDHIQARIIERRDSTLRVEIVTVFRGPLRSGRILELHISLASDGPAVLDGTIARPASIVDQARFIEAFLDGDPPAIIRDQIKFLEQRTSQPSGDPARESYLW